MFFPGETVRLLYDVPEAALPQGKDCQFLRLLPNDQAEVCYYAGNSTLTATLPLAALEPVLSTSTEQRAAVLWGLEKPPSEFLPAAIDCLLRHNCPISAGSNMVRLVYDRDERWWKRQDPFPGANNLDTPAIARDWHGCILAFSSDERFHLEFRLQGRREAAVLLHEREEAYAVQARRPAEATSLARLLMDLYEALGARCCAFPVADAWLVDEDWPSLLRAPYYPDFFLLPGRALPPDFPGPFRVAAVNEDRIMVTTLPVKFSPDYDPAEPSERDGKFATLRKAHALGEKYYDQLYDARGSTAGLYGDIKDAFLDAIAAANALGLKEEAAALEKRLQNIKGVYRSQFS